METESTLPKTYSTRRGPLLLYSQVTRSHSQVQSRPQCHNAKLSIELHKPLIYRNQELYFQVHFYPQLLLSPVLGYYGNQSSLRDQRQEEAGRSALHSTSGRAAEDPQGTNSCHFEQQNQSGRWNRPCIITGEYVCYVFTVCIIFTYNSNRDFVCTYVIDLIDTTVSKIRI